MLALTHFSDEWGPRSREIVIFDTHSEAIVQTLFSETFVRDVTWSADGVLLAGAGADIIEIWESETWQRVGVAQGHTAEIVTVVWSPDDNFLASASRDGTVRVWAVHRTP